MRKSFEDAQQKSKTLEPDAVLYFPERPLWVDLSVTEPTAPSALNRNMIEVGSAMNARADHKNGKYLRKAQGMDADFSPLVVETHARFHAGFITLLKRRATQLDGGQGLTAREMAVLLNLDLIKQRCPSRKSEEQSLDGVAQEQGEKRSTGRLTTSW